MDAIDIILSYSNYVPWEQGSELLEMGYRSWTFTITLLTYRECRDAKPSLQKLYKVGSEPGPRSGAEGSLVFVCP